METTSIQSALRTIVATEIGARHFADIDPSARLADAGLDVRRLLRRLQFSDEASVDPDRVTIAQLGSLLELQPTSMHTRLKDALVEARVTRLLVGTLLATQREPAYYDEAQWWWELARRVLWWYARREGDIGRDLVTRDSPGRAMHSLAALGLLDLDELATDRADNKSTFCNVLERLGYPEQVAGAAYVALAGMAIRIQRDCDGKVQQLLSPHVDRMADSLADELGGTADSETFPREAIRAWTAFVTGLPVTTWSPAVVDFIDKFRSQGVSGSMLVQIRSDLGMSLPDVDESLAQFMEGLCRGCDPENAADQHCVKEFADIEWEVECLDRPQLISSSQSGIRPAAVERRLPAIATGGPP